MGPEELSTQHQASKQQGILGVGGCETGVESMEEEMIRTAAYMRW